MAEGRLEERNEKRGEGVKGNEQIVKRRGGGLDAKLKWLEAGERVSALQN